MKVGALSTPGAFALWAAHLAQATSRLAAHSSNPTDHPVGSPERTQSAGLTHRANGQGFDIRV
jgi:hypothetical protein